MCQGLMRGNRLTGWQAHKDPLSWGKQAANEVIWVAGSLEIPPCTSAAVMGSILSMLVHPGQPQGNPWKSCPFPWQHCSQQQKFRRWATMSARQTNGWVPSRKDSGCSAESTAPSLSTPWNRILLFWVEKQILTAVFIPHPWVPLQRKAPSKLLGMGVLP